MIVWIEIRIFSLLRYKTPYLAPFVWSPEPEADESQRDWVGDFESVVCGDQVLEIVCQLDVTSDVLTERPLTIKSHHEPQLQGSKTPAQSLVSIVSRDALTWRRLLCGYHSILKSLTILKCNECWISIRNGFDYAFRVISTNNNSNVTPQ